MRQRKLIRTTLGDLIVAVTDEVVPIVRDPSGLYREKYPSYFAEGLAQEK